MRRTAWILVADMALGYLYSFTLGGGWDYSLFMIFVNALACVFITREPAGKWQSLIGWSFILQIGTDVGRVASEINSGPSNIWFVYWVTVALAYVQLLLLIGWGLSDGRVARYWRGGRPDPIVNSPRRQSVATCR